MRISRIALKGLHKKPWAWGALTALIVGLFFIFQVGADSEEKLISVSKGNISQEILVTGKVSSAEDLQLSFERSGKVVRVYKDVGSRVRSGETIATLSSGDLSARLASAEANVSAAVARLDELKRGARPEELAIKETALSEAKLALSKTYSSAFTTLENSYINAEDAIRKQTDAFFVRDEELNPALTFQTSDIQAQLDVEAGRVKMTKELAEWKSEISKLNPSSNSAELEGGILEAEPHLVSIQNFLKRLGDALVKESNLSPTEVTSYQTSLTTARTQVSTAISNLTLLKQSIAGQILVVEQAGNNLRLAQAGNSAEAIRGQEAQVAVARANVMDIEVEISKTVLRSPINGIITKQEAKTGQTVMAQAVMVQMISDAKFEIEADVPEVEIGRVKKGDEAVITFDAFPGEEFKGIIAFIDPAETIMGGVVNFKVKIAFLDEDPRIKSGFTADISIRTVNKENVLVIPQHLVVREVGIDYVIRLESGEKVRVPVQLGVRGKSGMMEVLSGLTEGDQLVGQ